MSAHALVVLAAWSKAAPKAEKVSYLGDARACSAQDSRPAAKAASCDDLDDGRPQSRQLLVRVFLGKAFLWDDGDARHVERDPR